MQLQKYIINLLKAICCRMLGPYKRAYMYIAVYC